MMPNIFTRDNNGDTGPNRALTCLQSPLAFMNGDMSHFHPLDIGDGIHFPRSIPANGDSKIFHMGAGFYKILCGRGIGHYGRGSPYTANS